MNIILIITITIIGILGIGSLIAYIMRAKIKVWVMKKIMDHAMQKMMTNMFDMPKEK